MKKIAILIFGMLICLSFISSNCTASSLKTGTITYQYGSATFDPYNTYSSFSKNLNIFEKGDYSLVYWSEDNYSDGLNIYLSVAKKDKWLYRGKKILKLSSSLYSSSGRTQYFVANNTIFSQSDGVIKATVINMETGEIQAEKNLGEVDSYISPFTLIQHKDKYGLLIPSESPSAYSIFLEGDLSKPLKISDPRNVLKKQFSWYSNFILSGKQDKLIMMNNLDNKVFDINARDMVYDNKGAEKSFQVGRAFHLKYYLAGKFYVTTSNSLTIDTYDDAFKKLETINLKPLEDKQNFSYYITGDKSKLRLWYVNNFKNTNSLKVITYNLGK